MGAGLFFQALYGTALCKIFGFSFTVLRLSTLVAAALGLFSFSRWLAALRVDQRGRAIAAYNAGPNAVERWISLHGDPRSNDLDPIDWIEMIPFRETRNYVQRVVENLSIYRRLIGKTELAYSLRAR